LRDRIARIKAWKEASLLRSVVVTVAAFVMLSCFSIGTLSFVAVAATRAVFKPAEPSAASASSAASTGGETLVASKSTAAKGGARSSRAGAGEKAGENE
jgi:hypothetical protein